MRWAAFAILGLTLGAAGPSGAHAQATSAFDGTWTGTGTLVTRRGTSCGPETTDRRFTIETGQIAFPYDLRHGMSFSGPIQADGRFDLASGRNRFMGQAAGSSMTATFSSADCHRTFTFRRRAARQ